MIVVEIGVTISKGYYKMMKIQKTGIKYFFNTKKSKLFFSTYQKYRKYYGDLKFKSLVPGQYNSFDPESGSGFDVMFFGTSANMPTKTRSASCIGLNVNKSVWLFDCGEGALKNIQASVVKSTNISKIFITHMHGDHVLGLPSLLISLNNLDREKSSENKIEMYFDHRSQYCCRYGPKGIEEYLTVTFKCLNVSYMLQNIVINELPSLFCILFFSFIISIVNSNYAIYEDSNVVVKGTFIEHTCDCIGY